MKHIRFTLNDFCLNTVGQMFTVLLILGALFLSNIPSTKLKTWVGLHAVNYGIPHVFFIWVILVIDTKIKWWYSMNNTP